MRGERPCSPPRGHLRRFFFWPPLFSGEATGFLSAAPSSAARASWALRRSSCALARAARARSSFSSSVSFLPPRFLLTGCTRICGSGRSEEHTSELQSRGHLVCRLLLHTI